MESGRSVTGRVIAEVAGHQVIAPVENVVRSFPCSLASGPLEPAISMTHRTRSQEWGSRRKVGQISLILKSVPTTRPYRSRVCHWQPNMPFMGRRPWQRREIGWPGIVIEHSRSKLFPSSTPAEPHSNPHLKSCRINSYPLSPPIVHPQ